MINQQVLEKFSHPIQALIFLDDDSPIRISSEKDGEISLAKELDRYILQCSRGLSVLGAAMDKAAFSIVLLKSSAVPLLNSIYSHAEQIEYAIENYFIRSGTIYDRALIFVSCLLDLGIADSAIKHDMIVTNDHVKRYGLDSHLKKLAKVCREYTEERNAIIHHRRYSEESFNQFSLIIAASALSVENGGDGTFSTKMIEEFEESMLDSHIEGFEKHLGEIDLQLVKFLDHAAAVYKIRRETYSKNAPIAVATVVGADSPIR